jgi:SAM-dependent methyltransferase
MAAEAFSSGAYWQARYLAGGNSGAGSYGRLGRFKADFLNGFIALNRIAGVIDFGCGDGAVLSLLDVPRYLGVDASREAVARCKARFRDRPALRFAAPDALAQEDAAPLALSLDVMFHLCEDAVFAAYLEQLFRFALDYVIIYSSNVEARTADPHVRHRRFSAAIAGRFADWRLLALVPNAYPYHPAQPEATSFCDFFVYGRQGSGCQIAVPRAG